MKKRIMGILLALTMVFSMMSAMTVTSFAGEAQVTANKVATELSGKSFSELKNYKPLVGVKNVKLSGDLKDDVQYLTGLLKSRKTTFKQLRAAFVEVFNDLDVNAKDVVVFSNKADGVYSPIRFAKPGDTIFVRAYGTSAKEEELGGLPSNLASMSALLPSGIKLTKVETPVTVEGGNTVSVYFFTMPDRMVTGYDFIGYNNTSLSEIFAKFFFRRAK